MMELAEHQKKARKPPGRPFEKGHPGGPGRKPGEAIGITRTLREAVELAARDCHPKGLAGWLVDRANGNVQDRQIFANMVSKVIPIQVNQSVNGGISINLGWLAGRQIGTSAAQAEVIDAQPVIAIEHSPSGHWTTNASAEQGQQLEAIERVEAAHDVATPAGHKRDGADDPGAI
jgi:hypothetical protein